MSGNRANGWKQSELVKIEQMGGNHGENEAKDCKERPKQSKKKSKHRAKNHQTPNIAQIKAYLIEQPTFVVI